MENQFITNNFELVFIPIFLFCCYVLLAILVVKYAKNLLEKTLNICFIILLLAYLPLLDYLAYWKPPIFWPSDFFYDDGSGSVLSYSEDEYSGYYPTAQIIYGLLSYVSGFLFIFSIILFITIINRKQSSRFPILNWIPLINNFSIGIQIIKILKPKLPHTLLIKFWIFISFVFIYYRFFAGWLYFLGFDSISFIGDIFYLSSEEAEIQENYGFRYTFVSDSLAIINPPLFYVSTFFSFLVFKLVNKKNSNISDYQISEIGKT